MTKSFLAFSGHDYYPGGGGRDFDCAFETEQDAIAYCDSKFTRDKMGQWVHIVYFDGEKMLLLYWKQEYYDYHSDSHIYELEKQDDYAEFEIIQEAVKETYDKHSD